MAYEMVMPYHLHMPSYFLETFTEYPYRIDQPTHRTEYQKETGAARFYYLRPIGFGSAMLGRVYKRNTHPGDSEMCICICN